MNQATWLCQVIYQQVYKYLFYALQSRFISFTEKAEYIDTHDCEECMHSIVLFPNALKTEPQIYFMLKIQLNKINKRFHYLPKFLLKFSQHFPCRCISLIVFFYCSPCLQNSWMRWKLIWLLWAHLVNHSQELGKNWIRKISEPNRFFIYYPYFLGTCNENLLWQFGNNMIKNIVKKKIFCIQVFPTYMYGRKTMYLYQSKKFDWL